MPRNRYQTGHLRRRAEPRKARRRIARMRLKLRAAEVASR